MCGPASLKFDNVCYENYFASAGNVFRCTRPQTIIKWLLNIPIIAQKSYRPMKLTFELTDAQAMALAQLCKRFGYSDAERFSNRYDNGKERDEMAAALLALERALVVSGISPR